VSGKLRAQLDYEVEPLTLNTGYANEAFAIPYGEGLIYCSDRRVNILINRVDSTDRQLYHLFYIPKRDSSKWGVSHLLSKSLPINAHQGPCSASADGEILYFTANDATGQHIYSAQKSGSSWGNVRPFAYNNADYTTTHPSLSTDGQRLFFASNMPGGAGGFDIYVCERTPRGWATPKNIGDGVNTTANELYPFIQANGTLYFSSSGHQSMGGMDIFSVRETGDVWGKPFRMEAPVNSVGNDLSYTAADADGTFGYIASDRAGKTLDIFSFKSLFPVFADCTEQEENDYTYIFREPGAVGRDAATDSITFRYVWNMGDGTIKHGAEVEHTFASVGQYTIRLDVVDTLTGELQTGVEEYALEVLDIEQPYITTPETITAGTSTTFDASKTWLPEFDIEEYYWIFGDGTRARGQHIEHTYSAPGVYRVQLGIVGKAKLTSAQLQYCSFLDITVR
jgi:hypothetical protein